MTVDGAEIVVARTARSAASALGSIAGAARFVGADLFPRGSRRAPSCSGSTRVAPSGSASSTRSPPSARALPRRLRPGAEASRDQPLARALRHRLRGRARNPRGERAGYGVSPGDENHPEPYVYVGPWSARAEGELWNASGFTGAELGYKELLEAHDPLETALAFFGSRYDGAARLSRWRCRVAAATGIVGWVRFGVLTGGGDCPGLNAVIRAIVRKGVADHGHEIVGFRDGWRGPLEDDCEPLDDRVDRAGSCRAAARSSARREPTRSSATTDPSRSAATSRELGLDGLIAIGGEDTLGAANRLHAEHGLPVLGVPKTIDNDIGATDVTFGFDTARPGRDRGDRPPAHDRREPQPDHGRRGDGPPRRLDRALRRDRRRRRRDPDPRAAVRHRARSAS